MHPSAPTELGELIEAYSATTQAVLDLGMTCRDEDFDLPTQCEGWTVKDQISHVVGLEDALNGGAAPQVEVPDHEWLRNDFGRFMQTHVEARRDVPGAEVVAELTELLPQRLAAYQQMLADPEVEVETPLGQRRPATFVALRTMDIWCHEQDIRQALNRPGNLDSPGAAIFTQRLLDAFPTRVMKADLPIGSVVIIESTGPVQARSGVRIVEQDGQPHAEPLFAGDSHVEGDVADDTTTIRLSTDELTRRGAGRVSVDDLRYHVDGDEDVARRVLEVLPITP